MHLPDFILLVIGTLAAIAAGLAVLASNYRVARVLFWIAGVAFGSLGVVWSATSEGYSLPTQMTVSAVIGAIAAAGLAWTLWEVKEKEKAAPTPKIAEEKPATERRGATLEADTGGRINAEGAMMPGNLPFQFGKVSSGGVIHMPGIQVLPNNDGTFKIEVPNKPQNTQYPLPTGEFKHLSENQIKQRAKAIAEGLRAFQERFAADWQTLPKDSNGGTQDDAFKTFYDRWKAEYEAKYVNEAQSLVSEYLSRGHQITTPPNNPMVGAGGVALFYKSFAGPRPALEVATFLDYLANDGTSPK